jgi:hypothetical protein
MNDPTTQTTDTGFATLGEQACWNLLPDTGIGRLAWAEPDGRIVVVPVNFGRDARSVVIRTGDTAPCPTPPATAAAAASRSRTSNPGCAAAGQSSSTPPSPRSRTRSSPTGSPARSTRGCANRGRSCCSCRSTGWPGAACTGSAACR